MTTPTHCPRCGERIAPVACYACGSQCIERGDSFCRDCGAPWPRIDQTPLEPEPPSVYEVNSVQGALALADKDVPFKDIAAWTDQERSDAYEWGIAVHLNAGDCGDVEVPAMPDFLAGYPRVELDWPSPDASGSQATPKAKKGRSQCGIYFDIHVAKWIEAEAKRSQMGVGDYLDSIIGDYEWHDEWEGRPLDGSGLSVSYWMLTERKAAFKDRCTSEGLTMSEVLRWMVAAEMAECEEAAAEEEPSS